MRCVRLVRVLLLAAATACGGSGPGAPRLGAADILPVPGALDAFGPDVRADAGSDAVADAGKDGAAGEDLPADVEAGQGDVAFLDLAAESGGDAVSDDASDPVGDAVSDASADDSASDTHADTAPDMLADTASDVAFDVAGLCLDPSCILCRPCRTDADCNLGGGVANVCIAYGTDGSFCGIPCASDGACPGGTACDGQSGGWHCRATAGGGCPCLDGFLGYQTTCLVENAFGACPGERTCDQPCQGPEAGPEVCDGVDNDCDGATDGEDSLRCGVGECATSVIACVNGLLQHCQPGQPKPEACNLLDDDCDGATDEDLGTIDCGVGACLASVPACTAGVPGTCVPGTPGTEGCNGADDDCDGSVDEDLGTTTCGIGPCTATVPACEDGAPTVCVPGAPGTEVCNGADDDCDGSVDEDLGQTTCGTGPCVRTVETCVGGQVQPCVPGPVPAGTCDAPPAQCHVTTTGKDACGNPCTKVGPAKCFTVHPACLTSGPGQPTDTAQCTTPKGRYDCGLTCQQFPNTIGADCTYCWNIHCDDKPGKDEAQFQCKNIPVAPTY